jgi:hypothetical protein
LIARNQERPGSPALVAAAAVLAALSVLAAWLDIRYGWITVAFDAVAHQFYEIPMLGRIRRPSQLVLVRCHLTIAAALTVAGLLLSARLGRHGRVWIAVFLCGYALRALVWICGGNLPLVPGDSCHYIEIATSVLRGEGPVKHYVESFFTDYPQIREGRGILDDWATPLDAYVRALTFRLAGITPDSPLETRLAAAKTCSFVINLLALPALYGFARRRFGSQIGLGAMALLAMLPVHAIYAGFILRESLVALTSILAVWTLTEVWTATPGTRHAWLWSLAAGVSGGLAILARTTALALVGASALIWIFFFARRRLGPFLLWSAALALVISPWAIATTSEYGRPFYTYTNFFEYNFSWTIHHYEKGNTSPSQFYTLANLPEIVRIKIKSILIIIVTSTMIVSLPVIAAFFRKLFTRGTQGRETDLVVAAIALAFVAGTLKSTSDVTQVAQLGRYYLPVFVLMLPSAVAGFVAWFASVQLDRKVISWLAAGTCALLWADPTWAYDASWFAKPFQLHWPTLRAAGAWIEDHPDRVPPSARIMTWFPWELRAVSNRPTVLMPRNYDPRRIAEVIQQYKVTHLLWGSFEPPPDIDPESWGRYLEQLRTTLGLTADREIFKSARNELYPVCLYELRR